MAWRTWILAVVASGLAVGCTRHSDSAVPVPMSSAQTGSSVTGDATGGVAGGDVGSSILASIDNARRAIALRDPIAAANDISHDLDLAQKATGQAQPVPEGRAGSLTALLQSFPVQVKLLSAQALLTSGNVAGADSILMSIQSLVPPRLMPRNLPLDEAMTSLDRATEAAALGMPQLRTQLLCAQAALHSYRGPAHAAEAMALASTLDAALANPTQLRTLLPDQVSIWRSNVGQWTEAAQVG